MASLPARPARPVGDQPDLDLLCFEPYMPAAAARGMFEFLRAELPFYRVEYDIKRGGVQTHVRTPRLVPCFHGLSPRRMSMEEVSGSRPGAVLGLNR